MASALVLGASPGVMAGSAAASAGGQSEPILCTGSVTVDYSPSLGLLPQLTTQRVTEALGTDGGGACSGPFSGGTAITTFQQQVGCLLQGPGDTLVENVVTYHWQDGRSSTITYGLTTVAHVAGQLVVTSTGTVSGGYGAGALSERIAAYPGIDVLDCVASHVDQQTGVISMSVL